VKRHADVALYADCHEDRYNSGLAPLSMSILHKGFYRAVLHYALPTIRKVLCVTPETLEFARDVYSVPGSMLELYPLGGVVFTDEEYADRRRSLRHKLGVRDSEVVIIQSGKMGPAKKVIESLRAFRETAADNMQLVLIGSFDDAIRDEAMQLIAETPNVRFLGWMAGPELNDFLCAADLYLQPGTQSVTMQNALCARCPVVLDDVPSHKWVVDGNGWLLNAATPLKGVLAEIARDPSKLRKMSERSLALARKHLDYKKLAARVCS
jgi:glycosyltransferase involved in cell wall biosynthesis